MITYTLRDFIIEQHGNEVGGTRQAMTWRERFAPIIRRVLARTAGKSRGDINWALHDAFPLRPHANYPYKIWREEVARQRRDTRQQSLFQTAGRTAGGPKKEH